MKKVAHCHKLVAEVAQEAAMECYEVLMSSNNKFYKDWKAQFPNFSAKERQAAFAKKNWGQFIPFARSTLAKLLTSPTLAESQKEDILEALALDQTLALGRKNPAIQLN